MNPSPSSTSCPLKILMTVIAACSLAFLILPGCASSDSGTPEVNSSMYYGVGFHDPWYYGAAYYPPDIIVTPPARPVDPPHVQHPIVTPPPSAAPAPRPLPSIPSAPRPAFRR